MPMMTSQSPVAPEMKDLGFGVRVSTMVMGVQTVFRQAAVALLFPKTAGPGNPFSYFSFLRCSPP